MIYQVPPENEYPPAYWSDLDDDDEEYGGAVPCCICSCLIGDEVEFGQANYWGDGRPICANCLEAALLEEALEGDKVMNKKVFLGGTCNDSQWRDQLIPMLTIDYYNPVVEDWTPACQDEEIRQRQTCDYCLYVITPRMTGVYSIAEVVDDSNKRPDKTVFCFLENDGDSRFTPGQMKSLRAVGSMVAGNGGQVFLSLEECAAFLNDVGLAALEGEQS